MAMGVPFEPSTSSVHEALKKTVGNVSKAAFLLKCDPATLYQWLFDRPDMMEIVYALRKLAREVELDESEDVIKYAQTVKDKDLNNALRAAMYKLNNLGKKREYNHPEALAAEAQKTVADRVVEQLEAISIKEMASECSDEAKTPKIRS